MESGEASELPQSPGEPVLCDVGVGGLSVGEAEFLHVGLCTVRYGAVHKVQGDPQGGFAAAQGPPGQVR